jgi:hypothetical protein
MTLHWRGRVVGLMRSIAEPGLDWDVGFDIGDGLVMTERGAKK